MMQDAESNLEREELGSILPDARHQTDPEPSTDPQSRKTILRSEHNDTVGISSVVQRFTEGSIPDSYSVVERTETYYGPELLLAVDARNYRLTAPGPDTQLLLWGEITNDRGYREAWERLAEVQAFIDEAPQYEICTQCDSPIRSKEHERFSAIGRCPKVAN